MKRLISVLAALIMSLTFLIGCKDKPVAQTDVLTQIYRDPSKTELTVMVKNAFSINAFEKEVESKFPNINLIQVGNHSYDMGILEYEARIKNDDLTDIVMTWPLDVGNEYWSDRLLDLSTLAVTRNYTTKSLNDIALKQNGKLFYLPGPAQVRGIVYNKTMFEENNWEVAHDFDSFIELCKTIEKSGIRSLQLGLKNKEVLDTAFIGYSYGECFSTSYDAEAKTKFDEGETSFADNYTYALNTFKKLIDYGVLNKSDLDVDYSDREAMLWSRKCAMIEDSVLIARMGESAAGSTDEFALMPFFNEGEYNDWSRLYPVCFIGLNKHLTDKGSEAKYKAALDLIDYISTPEGQASLAADTEAMYSSLKGVPAPEVAEIEQLETSLNAGRYGIFPTFKNAQKALRSGLEGMLKDNLTIDEVIQLVDKENANPKLEARPLWVGEASENFTLMETAHLLTDNMRELTNSDIALFLDNGKDGLSNGKGLNGKFYKGEITYNDIERILPDYKHGDTGEMVKVTMTGRDLIETLEKSITVNNGIGGWFYYFSGLKMKFSPSAIPGSRIKSITDDKGNFIGLDKVYSIAILDKSVRDSLVISSEKTGLKIRDVLEKSVAQKGLISPMRDNRFIVV